MSKKITTEDFVKDSNIVHNNFYDYSKTNYVKAKTKVIITCKEHGDFSQTPNSHKNGNGCPKCGHKSKKKWSKSRFIKELKSRCGNELPYDVIGEYKGTSNNILIENKYGVCNVRANHLLSGVIPGIETALDSTEYWKNQAIETHSFLYDYSNSVYKNSDTNIKIVCKKHGVFEQIPYVHIRGSHCPKCAFKEMGLEKSKKYSKNYSKKANKKHNNRYKYLKDKVFKAKDTVEIECPIHGIFHQVADNHLRGDGCSQCSIVELSKRMRENPPGWSFTNWQKAGERSKVFESFKCYIIKCWNEKEEFYKIGKTFNVISYRFRGKKNMPYNYEIIKLFEGGAREISKLEKKLQKANRDFKYIPKIIFTGMYECYESLTNILDFLE